MVSVLVSELLLRVFVSSRVPVPVKIECVAECASVVGGDSIDMEYYISEYIFPEARTCITPAQYWR